MGRVPAKQAKGGKAKKVAIKDRGPGRRGAMLAGASSVFSAEV